MLDKMITVAHSLLGLASYVQFFLARLTIHARERNSLHTRRWES